MAQGAFALPMPLPIEASEAPLATSFIECLHFEGVKGQLGCVGAGVLLEQQHLLSTGRLVSVCHQKGPHA
jgi:hypothetical protein